MNIKIAGKWMFIPVKMVLIGIDPYPFLHKVSESISLMVGVSNLGRVSNLSGVFKNWLQAQFLDWLEYGL